MTRAGSLPELLSCCALRAQHAASRACRQSARRISAGMDRARAGGSMCRSSPLVDPAVAEATAGHGAAPAACPNGAWRPSSGCAGTPTQAHVAGRAAGSARRISAGVDRAPRRLPTRSGPATCLPRNAPLSGCARTPYASSTPPRVRAARSAPQIQDRLNLADPPHAAHPRHKTRPIRNPCASWRGRHG